MTVSINEQRKEQQYTKKKHVQQRKPAIQKLAGAHRASGSSSKYMVAACLVLAAAAFYRLNPSISYLQNIGVTFSRRNSSETCKTGPSDANGSVLSTAESSVAEIFQDSMTQQADDVHDSEKPTEQQLMAPAHHPDPTCRLHGMVDECCNCTYQAVDSMNEAVYPILKRLVATPFFRYFKVNLYSDCPLWPDDSRCAMKACSVCQCEPHELPKPWIVAEGYNNDPECAAVSKSGNDDDDDYLDDSDSDDDVGMHHTSQQQEQTSHNDEYQSLDDAHFDSPDSDSESDGTADDASSNGGSCSASEDGSCTIAGPGNAAQEDSLVDTQLEDGMHTKLQHLPGWRGLNNPWMSEGENGEEYLYINLLNNPERYTGYKGEHAHRIWRTIYSQSCFTELEDCHEKRVFYRLISGMHASISAHIAANYLLDELMGTWGPSPQQFKERLGTPLVRERVQNLYFAYLFVLRAVTKAGALLEQYQYDTGLPEQDEETMRLISQLVSSRELQSACPMPFDEGRLWKGEEGPALLASMQEAFRNITRVMDCVGCEKCKLWGKLQTLGIATALKVLFSSPDCTGRQPDPSQPFSVLQLERNEVIALVNLLERFSASLTYYKTMAAQQERDEPATPRAVEQAGTVE